jgi:hypothetical protein
LDDGKIYRKALYLMVILRPGPLCCPEVYRDVPGKFHDDDDDDDDDD